MRKLKAVQRRACGEALARVTLARAVRALWIGLADERSKQWIEPQCVVIVHVFVAERDRVNALGDKLKSRVLDARGVAVIAKAGRETREDLAALFDRTQQQRASVGGDVSAARNKRRNCGDLGPWRGGVAGYTLSLEPLGVFWVIGVRYLHYLTNGGSLTEAW